MHCKQLLIGDKMQVTEMNRYQSLVEKVLKNQSDNSFPNFTYDAGPFQPNMKELLSNIEQINVAKSFSALPLRVSQPTISAKANSQSIETLSLDWGDSRTFMSEKTAKSNSTAKRSLIFASQKFSKNKVGKKTEESVTVYYFDLPVNKVIKYDRKTTVADLIYQAIELYLGDDSLDHSKIKDRNISNYELRMLANDQGFKADMRIPSISYDRLLADNLFDFLVLRPKDKKDRKYSDSQPIKFVNTSIKKTCLTIFLYNQLGEELGTLNMLYTESLQKIFDHIQNNDLHNMRSYYLASNKNDVDGLPRDFEVKNLESDKIYIKAKKYIDESDFDSKAKPIRNLSFVSRESDPKIQMPIGLSEASQYEEFPVIKINSMGFEQERILGIDQTKVYNYDKSYRQEKRQSSIFDKLLGLNQQTGTKKPFRLISDIMSLKKMEKGLMVTFKEKAIVYMVKNLETRDKIFRKLNYLVSHNQRDALMGSRNKV